ncbi:GtrA family protein [Rhodococcoides corynebacterioides]|uniref:GtrA family protein n=1 Tax=Rhodococcoides corynebacterioides TaxID=53972 RepID=UPI001C9B5BEB|nr:GtrA family protein [Rhodococcus corynebacterioides]MBY6349616.1 GtrA family protein [Rhodococcus corynebacterioides]
MRGRVIAAAVVRNDSVVPQLVRFAAVGAVSNVLYVAVFVLMQPEGRVIANVAGAAASTVLANELHRRLTFHAGERVHWFTAQWEAGGLALVGLMVSTAAVTALEVAAPGTGAVASAVLVVAVTAVVGALRFLALRGWVF